MWLNVLNIVANFVFFKQKIKLFATLGEKKNSGKIDKQKANIFANQNKLRRRQT